MILVLTASIMYWSLQHQTVESESSVVAEDIIETSSIEGDVTMDDAASDAGSDS